MDKIFEIDNLRCSYDRKYREGISKVVLEISHLIVPRGKKVFIVGESGIGKSTILETLGLMNNTIVPDENSRFVFYENENSIIDLAGMWKCSDDEISDFRLKNFSFIFQSTNLMRNFTAYENIALTRMLQGYSQEASFEAATEVLKDLGLEHIDATRMTQELSGGQQQRLAFARAILPDFTVLFGDEPTGNLDSDNAVRAMEILTGKLNKLQGSSAIIVSHDMHLSTMFADVIIKIRTAGRPLVSVKDEVVYYGVIDDDCVFVKDQSGNWTNGKEKYEAHDFELFLRSI